jgi:hypothetical protein
MGNNSTNTKSDEDAEAMFQNATRLSNANESIMIEDIVHNIIMNTVPMDTADGSFHVLKQTMSFEDSPFMTWEADHDVHTVLSPRTMNMYNLKFWPIALHFWHEHQFGPTRNEAMARYAIRHDHEKDKNHIGILVDSTSSGNSSSSLDQHSVGVFDYECDTGTKLSRNEWNHANGKGFGATSNTQGIDQIHLGITTGRVDLFMTKRYDIQCCFFP